MEHTKKPQIIIVSGPSGSGKGTVIDLLPASFKKAVSMTTRTIRPGEIDGVDYIFISKERFEQLIEEGGMLEYNCYAGRFYGTPRSEITDTLAQGRHVVLDIDVNGARNIRKLYPEARTVFIMPPDLRTQRKRLIGRNTETPDTIAARIEVTHAEIACAREFDCIIINRDGGVKEAARQLEAFAEGILPDQSGVAELIANYFQE